ncbi:MAG: tRNA (adenosine(37)-N6)-threonylcarbamoyltransferase complex transferase subunit TsaD [Candidatus Dojkabacteria bacterium]
MKNSDFKQNLILAIDTSCDETSVAVVKGDKALSNLYSSQIELHKQYGGVVPSIAKLAHQERIDSILKQSLKRAKISLEQLDAVAVTQGPGLAIALEIGILKAKEVAEKYNKPLVSVNHMEGHLLSGLIHRNSKSDSRDEVEFPVLGVLVSGKHTELVLVEDFGKYKVIGETLDDACGECFDKCGRLLGLGYPAGPAITKFAKERRVNINLEVVHKNTSVLVKGTNIHTNKEYFLPVSMANSGDLNFSYSGLKTAFRDLVSKLPELDAETIKDLCVVFEHAALLQIITKLEKAIRQYNPKEIWLGGGVVANARLRTLVRKSAKGLKVRYPSSKKLTGDNAAMIGVAANYCLNQNRGVYRDSKDFDKIDREPNLTF